MNTTYDDDYPTCERTYATLRIYHEAIDLTLISDELGIEPSGTQVKGGVCTVSCGLERVPEIGAWFLSSDDGIGSKDVRRHVDWLLAEVDGNDRELKDLLESAHTIDA